MARRPRDGAGAGRAGRGRGRRCWPARERPIVLAPRRAGAPVAAAVAPRSAELGVMLPYSPLHHLLLADAATTLVMTSGNVSDEPIAYRDDDARERLAGSPTRPAPRPPDPHAHRRLGRARRRRPAADAAPLARLRARRRSRCPSPRPALLACGAELKSTFCVAKGARAWVGHHIGDLRNEETLRSFTEGDRALRARCSPSTPEVVAHDLHPDYLSTTYALEREGVEHVAVQHHHAHLAAVPGRARRARPGGRGDLRRHRLRHRRHGVGRRAAGRRPRGLRARRRTCGRCGCPAATARCASRGGWPARGWPRRRDAEPAPLPGIEPRAWHAVAELARTGLAAPLTTSMGRLFDAVAALCGLRTEVTYEGQAAVELEAVADRSERGAYPLDVAARRARRAPDGRSPSRDDVAAGVDAGGRRRRASTARSRARPRRRAPRPRGARGLDTVVLSGGVFQNRLLLELDAWRCCAAPACACSCPSACRPTTAASRFGQAAVAARAQPAAALTKATKSSTSGRAGPTASRMTCHARGGGAGSMAITPSRPASTSEVTASADRNEIPRPIRAAWRIAPLEPTVSVSPCSALADRNSSLAERVPESGSRSSHVRPPSSPGATGCAAGERIVGGADEHELVGAKRPRVDALVVGRAPAEGDVGLVAQRASRGPGRGCRRSRPRRTSGMLEPRRPA